MACYHPLNRIYFRKEGWKVMGEDINGQQLMLWQNMYGAIEDQMKIPCGQCIGCRLDYSKEWATRCEIEMRQWEHNWFLTLTYDDEHLPLRQGVDQNTGELICNSYLVPNDLTQFMKSLRKKWDRHYNEQNIRFYGCGEYGSEHERAHYHVMLFNCNIRDLMPHHKNIKGNIIYTSKMIEEVWGKGLIGITEASWETAAYTARYMLKKQKGKNATSYYEAKHQTPEFTRMSRMPGIASEWYNQNKDHLWETDEIILAKGRKVHAPKYYDKLFDLEIEKLYATNEEDRCQELIQIRDRVHEKRRAAAEATAQLKTLQSSLTLQEQLTIEERSTQDRIKKMRRIV